MKNISQTPRVDCSRSKSCYISNLCDGFFFWFIDGSLGLTQLASTGETNSRKTKAARGKNSDWTKIEHWP